MVIIIIIIIIIINIDEGFVVKFKRTLGSLKI